MADISILSRLIGAAQRNVDLSSNTLVVGSVKVGGGTGTELTKTILDRLVSLQNGTDVNATYHTHDGRYFTESELSSSTGGSAGSTLIGDDNSYSNFSPSALTIKGALEGIDEALGSATAADAVDNIFRIVNNVDNTKKIAFDASGVATDTTRTIVMPDENVDLGLVSTAIQSSEKGANNGVATLDAGGKVPLSQLPSALMTYEGVWDASSNTPELADGVGDAGMVYRVGTAGTQDLGSGPISFEAGDYVIYNGSEWEKSDGTDAVTSVNGQQGVVSLDTDDINEGSTNLYHTVARARGAAVVNTLGGSETDQAPSVFAVNAALDLKQDADPALDEAVTFFESTDLTGSEAEQLSSGGNADSLHEHAVLKEIRVAGESFAANTTFAVRLARNSETAGRVMKADKDASTDKNYNVIGLALAGAGVDEGGNLTVVTEGTVTLGSNDTPFDTEDIGEEVFLGSNGAFILASDLSETANEAAFVIGVVEATNKIRVGGKHLRGIY